MVQVIIPAGGSGSRYSSSTSKLDETINQKSVLAHSIHQFHHHTSVSGIIIAVPANKVAGYEGLATAYPKCRVIIGGNTRAHSVHQAFQYISLPCEHVLIHDAARPNPSHALINRVLEGLTHHPVVIPGIPMSDTLKQINGESIVKTVNRSDIIAVQTPQGFHYSALLNAYNAATSLDEFTDEAAVLEHHGVYGVHVNGDRENIKITHPTDLRLARFYLSGDY
ncbi:MAG: 2-C-methyl-D-erythritol 4-phosphate cytidylyltransferase [Candidatus Margulisbacteria bacterium]|nr:2-C-methyl-D-erythritol 4-phosphate cytidylyltransferase [Candidatus Margulisiibacteriota bacterium]